MANVIGNANLKNLRVHYFYCLSSTVNRCECLLNNVTCSLSPSFLSLCLLLSFTGTGERELRETPDTDNDWNALWMLLAWHSHVIIEHFATRRKISGKRERQETKCVCVCVCVVTGRHWMFYARRSHSHSLSSSRGHSGWLWWEQGGQ